MGWDFDTLVRQIDDAKAHGSRPYRDENGRLHGPIKASHYNFAISVTEDLNDKFTETAILCGGSDIEFLAIHFVIRPINSKRFVSGCQIIYNQNITPLCYLDTDECIWSRFHRNVGGYILDDKVYECSEPQYVVIDSETCDYIGTHKGPLGL